MPGKRTKATLKIKGNHYYGSAKANDKSRHINGNIDFFRFDAPGYNYHNFWGPEPLEPFDDIDAPTSSRDDTLQGEPHSIIRARTLPGEPVVFTRGDYYPNSTNESEVQEFVPNQFAPFVTVSVAEKPNGGDDNENMASGFSERIEAVEAEDAGQSITMSLSTTGSTTSAPSTYDPNQKFGGERIYQNIQAQDNSHQVNGDIIHNVNNHNIMHNHNLNLNVAPEGVLLPAAAMAIAESKTVTVTANPSLIATVDSSESTHPTTTTSTATISDSIDPASNTSTAGANSSDSVTLSGSKTSSSANPAPAELLSSSSSIESTLTQKPEPTHPPLSTHHPSQPGSAAPNGVRHFWTHIRLLTATLLRLDSAPAAILRDVIQEAGSFVANGAFGLELGMETIVMLITAFWTAEHQSSTPEVSRLGARIR